MNFLAALLKPLYSLLIDKGLKLITNWIKEIKTQSKEKQDVKNCLDIKDPIKRSKCIKSELDD